MLVAQTNPRKNTLIGAIPDADWDRFNKNLTPVVMELGDVIYESGNDQPYVFFPTSSIVSLLYVMENGAAAEIAIVGNEGLVGITLFMGGGSTSNRAVVQSAGYGFRMKGQYIRDEFVRAGSIQQLFLRYTQALIAQMGQTAVCNRHHSLTQQLCRWLLMSLDRLPTNELKMTQELIANMLGVRREGVTEAAGNLQRSGAIEYHRGHIRVLNRPLLETMVCECYEVVRNEYARLLPWDNSQNAKSATRPKKSPPTRRSRKAED